MNYIGSKNKLSSWLLEHVKQTCGEALNELVFCDLFAGTGIVGRTFKTEAKQVIANDLEYYSYVLNRNYIGNHKALNIEPLFDELNALKPIKGFIYNEYADGGSGGRMYFSAHNGQKADAIRTTLEIWKKEGKINEDEYFFLLASLLESLDKVANTASVYGAFLKKIKKSAQRELVLKPAYFEKTSQAHQVYNADANALIKTISGDILYLDPPYNARQYGANYHLLNTIAIYNTFVPKGITGLPQYNKSAFCRTGEVEQAFEEIISAANFRYIFLSYNNEGLMSKKVVQEIMQRYGSYNLVTKAYQRFKADKTENRNHKASATTEYLHILEKNI